MLNLQDDPDRHVSRDDISGIYQKAVNGPLGPFISNSEAQWVSSDIMGTAAAVVVEGQETRVQKGAVRANVTPGCRIFPEKSLHPANGCKVEIPVNQLVGYGGTIMNWVHLPICSVSEPLPLAGALLTENVTSFSAAFLDELTICRKAGK